MKNLRLAGVAFVGCICMSCVSCMEKREESIEFHIMKASDVISLMSIVQQKKPIVQYNKIHIHALEIREKFSAIVDGYMLAILYPHLRINGTVCVYEGLEIAPNIMQQTKCHSKASCFKRSGNEFTKIQ